MIGLVGGSGDFGQGLAERLRQSGEEVVIGSRTPRDEFVSNAEASQVSDVVLLCVPPENVESMARELADDLAGKIVVSVAAPVVFRDGKAGANPGKLSLAELAQAAAPRARVVSALNTVSAKTLARLDHELDEDVIVCGDDEEAKQIVARIVERLVTGRAVDAGRLEVARWVEPMTAVLLNINRRYKTNAGFRVTGLP